MSGVGNSQGPTGAVDWIGLRMSWGTFGMSMLSPDMLPEGHISSLAYLSSLITSHHAMKMFALYNALKMFACLKANTLVADMSPDTVMHFGMPTAAKGTVTSLLSIVTCTEQASPSKFERPNHSTV